MAFATRTIALAMALLLAGVAMAQPSNPCMYSDGKFV